MASTPVRRQPGGGISDVCLSLAQLDPHPVGDVALGLLI